MENLEKSPGRGVFMRKTWEELAKAGSPAMSMNEISDFLERGDKMLNRSEVLDIIKRYFERKLQTVLDENGKEVTIWQSAPRKAELAAALGVDITTLSRYVAGEYGGREYVGGIDTRGRINKEDFDLVRKAYQIIVDYYESKLSENRNPAGLIYWLNNSLNERWSNEQTIKLEPQARYAYQPRISPDELIQLAEHGQDGEIIGGGDPDF